MRSMSRTDAAPQNQWLRAALDRQPRVSLASLPTPLEHLPRLTAALGGPQIYVKRDDLTGLAFGGNKTRALEFVLGDLLAREKPDVLVTGANIQSNWSRQSAAAAARLGIPIVLVLRNTEMQELQGNVLLDLWLGADVRFVDEPDVTAIIGSHLDRVVAELRAEGKRAVKIDPWAPCVALGYVAMMLELQAQCEAMGVRPTRIWTAAAGPTQSGMVLGARLLEWPIQVTGIAPIEWTDRSMEAATAASANAAAEVLGSPVRVSPEEIDSHSEYMAPGYGRPSPAGLDAMRLLARTDALLLDPVYTSKAMAGLIDHVRRGILGPDDVVVFLHTGGLPAVFAYRDAVLEMARTGSAEPVASARA
jgi:1-aminocyclopropane-1-carboxylate deaminase/D-cysteine desulfhydrase-like pyridoxal-dependent ACC family enzyme